MDIKAVKELIGALESSSLTRLHYEDDTLKITLEKGQAPAPAAVLSAALPAAGADAPQPVAQAAPANENDCTVTAPIVGTVYRAREPGQSPLVSVGDTVQEGDTLCLIEAMKVFGDVNAPCTGVVKTIHFNDGELAEFGAPLITIGKTV